MLSGKNWNKKPLHEDNIRIAQFSPKKRGLPSYIGARYLPGTTHRVESMRDGVDSHDLGGGIRNARPKAYTSGTCIKSIRI